MGTIVDSVVPLFMEPTDENKAQMRSLLCHCNVAGVLAVNDPAYPDEAVEEAWLLGMLSCSDFEVKFRHILHSRGINMSAYVCVHDVDTCFFSCVTIRVQ